MPRFLAAIYTVLLFCGAMLLLGLSACSTPQRIEAVPERYAAQAKLPGLDDLRYVVGDAEDMQRLAQDMMDTWPRERRWLEQQGLGSEALPPSHILALSGGGDNGAFGAGLLRGWSVKGDRPEFSLVTGISTGALIAPFAFLGTAYDEKLRDLYTRTSPKDIIEPRSFWAVITDDAMADTMPLRQQLRKHIDRAFLDQIALEYVKGRELWISTTNLDARQRVIWNMTKLASSQHPNAVALFHDIMLASSAIPGAFPPVMINVELDGKPHQEMHVDGGTMAQVFVYPPNIKLGELARANGGSRKRNLYVVMNSRLDPEWAQTERRVISIASRAISSMIHTQGVGDLYRIFLTAKRDGMDFHLAFIPADFKYLHRQEFDTAFMQALYERGETMAREGYPWQTLPPGFN
ncbi:patatin-like phospholipase family protein [Rhodoferax aquaticus]|uniref:Patatin family protein n=1 Tax=Rhodoferax aquaticus TaxID=2527691 RepID=A0A515EPD0_9BURK|nr:patatin-like phospholipase family protein [Rhodoferax aquaticus]QDL54523.1 patatin family protein [Rhodoferax aquaticus]